MHLSRLGWESLYFSDFSANSDLSCLELCDPAHILNIKKCPLHLLFSHKWKVIGRRALWLPVWLNSFVDYHNFRQNSRQKRKIKMLISKAGNCAYQDILLKVISNYFTKVHITRTARKIIRQTFCMKFLIFKKSTKKTSSTKMREKLDFIRFWCFLKVSNCKT